MRRLLDYLIHSYIWIALAALLMAFQAQVELGLPLHFRPYHSLIFFATLFEYNLHRLNTFIFYPQSLQLEKYKWTRQHPYLFWMISCISFLGLTTSLFYMKPSVLMSLLPLAILTIFYSVPVVKLKGRQYKLRDIPYLKIFIIATVWSCVCTILPFMESGMNRSYWQIVGIIVLRFLFIFAITIPFDIRDKEADMASGLNTLIHVTGVDKAYRMARFISLAMTSLSILQDAYFNSGYFIPAYALSGVICYHFLSSKKLRKHRLYHMGFLDACILIQSSLVLIVYFLRNLF